VLRRKLVSWLRTRASQPELDAVMDTVMRASASTGSLLASPGEVANKWARVAGERNAGRFALHSSRTKAVRAEPPPSLSRQTTAGSEVGLSRQSSAALGADAPTPSREPSAGAAAAAPPSPLRRLGAPPPVVGQPSDADASAEVATMADSADLAVEVAAGTRGESLDVRLPLAHGRVEVVGLGHALGVV